MKLYCIYAMWFNAYKKCSLVCFVLGGICVAWQCCHSMKKAIFPYIEQGKCHRLG